VRLSKRKLQANGRNALGNQREQGALTGIALQTAVNGAVQIAILVRYLCLLKVFPDAPGAVLPAHLEFCMLRAG
jgi:hypothetical protein